MRKKAVFSVVAIALVVGLVAGGLSAGLTLADPSPGAPTVVNYQGLLLDSATGDPVADGDYEFLFSIYDVETGGTALWSETQTLSVEDGMFSALLGSVKPLGASVFEDSPRYLGIKVGADPEMTPRQLLASVPYALQAENADTVDGMEGADLEESAEIDADIAAHASDPSAHHARYTDAEALAAVLAGDGSGSGLDADLLDGLDSSEFLSALSDYGRSGVAVNLYEGTTALSDKYVNQSGDSMIGANPDPLLSVRNLGSGDGIYAYTDTGKKAIYGKAVVTGGCAIYGEGIGFATGVRGDGDPGVYGYSETYTGVYGRSYEGTGVYGVATTAGSYGVYGATEYLGEGAWAGYFDGDVHVDADLTVKETISEGGLPLSDRYAPKTHTHSGDDITSGTVADARIAASIARDSEIMPTVLANDGSGSGLDADLLDGHNSSYFVATGSDYGRSGVAANLYEGTTMLSAKYAAISHTHSGADITSGTVADARIAGSIARDSEIMPVVLANDGSGSGLDADLLDGQHGSWYQDAGNIDFGTLDTARFSAMTDLGAEGYLGNAPGDVAQNNGIRQTNLNADLLDEHDSSYFVATGSDYGRSGVAANLYEGAITLTDKYVNESGDSMTGSSASALLSVTNSGSGHGVSGFSSGQGVHGEASGSSGIGVYGAATNSGDVTNYGGYFLAYGKDGQGVSGLATGSSGIGVAGVASNSGDVTNFGGYFSASGTSGTGVYGYASGSEGYGVQGYASYGYGVEGYSAGSSGRGVYGWASSYNGYGVYGEASYTGNEENYGGYFEAAGYWGQGVYGAATSTASATNYGGHFTAAGTSGRGVYGEATGSYGYGVYGTASASLGRGVVGEASGSYGIGVYGEASDSGDVTNYGGYFLASGSYGKGVYGKATGTTAADGVKGEATGSNGYGVYGTASGSSGRGVVGEATGSSGRGVWGSASGSATYAGYFSGDVHVTGELTATTKTFVQPHPTDPSKEIAYVCLEGGENGVYVRGSGQLQDGRAEIELPEHFALVAAEEGLTVQITPLSDCRGIFVVAKSTDRIVVKETQGGTSDASFDYLVMGVRRGFEEHEVIQENEHMKPDRDMSQEEYEDWLALPQNQGLQSLLIENGTLTPEGKINLETAEGLGWELGPETKAERMEERGLGGPEAEASSE